MKKELVGQFLEDLALWAASQKEILAVALVGSYARDAANPDSDVDIMFITSHPEQYMIDSSWATNYGVIEKQQTEQYGLVTSLRIWYVSGLEVEYGITDERWVALPLDAGTKRVISDGLCVLFERGNILSQHQFQ